MCISDSAALIATDMVAFLLVTGAHLPKFSSQPFAFRLGQLGVTHTRNVNLAPTYQWLA
jgi:hypothetical protein